MSGHSKSLGGTMTSGRTIAKSACLQFRSRITYLTSILHIFQKISSANTAEDNSIFFRFKAFTTPNMMVFMDFRLLVHKPSESRAWLGAHLSGSPFPGCEARTAR